MNDLASLFFIFYKIAKEIFCNIFQTVHSLPADFKRDVVDHVHEQNVLQGVDDDRDIRVKGDALKGAVEFP